MTRRTGLLPRVAAGLGAPALALVAVAGCSSEREASSAPPGSVVDVLGSVGSAPPTSGRAVVQIDEVAMVGDSITAGSDAELAAAFAAIGLPDAEVDAESGRRMVVSGDVSSGLDGIEEVLDDGAEPDLWVIALGTNDVANYEVEEYAGAIGELLSAIPDGAPVVWVDCYLADHPEESAAFGDTLRQVLAERGNATVVDWQSVATEDGVLSDGVHPSGFGRTEFARRVTDAVAAWMG